MKAARGFAAVTIVALASFIALDQYWFSERTREGEGGHWSRTLGKEQEEWLRRTLETSKAKFAFVFTHHLVGGETARGRGGVEASHCKEWETRQSSEDPFTGRVGCPFLEGAARNSAARTRSRRSAPAAPHRSTICARKDKATGDVHVRNGSAVLKNTLTAAVQCAGE